MVIINDRVLDWIQKGEIADRYFNPENTFSHIELVLLNQETLPQSELQKLVGDATVSVHCFPSGTPLFVKTLGWNTRLLSRWCLPIVQLAKNTQVDIVRCHGAWLNAFVAREIKKKLGIPYVISLHTHMDESIRNRPMGPLRRIRDLCYQKFEKQVLHDSSCVLPVYTSIKSYLDRLGITNYQVCYNALNGNYLSKKQNYELHNPVRLISVGRLIPGKNPEFLIKALQHFPEVEATFVGQGELKTKLSALTQTLKLDRRVHFVDAIPNSELCQTLKDYDLFAVHCDYWGIPKTVMEAILAGMPVIINRREPEPVEELSADVCFFVDNTEESWTSGLRDLISNPTLRKNLGQTAARKSEEMFGPRKAENKFATIYRRLLGAHA